MGLVLYDLLLRMKYPVPQQEIVVYGREGGERCNVFLGSTQYDDMRVLDEDEADIIEFVLMAVSHEQFAIQSEDPAGADPKLSLKDLSLNGTFVSFEGGEYQRAKSARDGELNAVKGLPIATGSRIRLGDSSDHILEVMSDDAASGLLLAFQSLKDLPAEEEPEKKQKKKGLFGFLKRK
jgi:hypothetical protein